MYYNMRITAFCFSYTEEDSSRDPTPDFTLQNFWSKLGKYGIIIKYIISPNYFGCLQKYKLAYTLSNFEIIFIDNTMKRLKPRRGRR